MVIDKQKIEKYPVTIHNLVTHFGFPVELLRALSFDDMCSFFDLHGLYIGITSDPDGLFWVPEVCGVPFRVCSTRLEAQDVAIEECMHMMEEMINFEVK